MCWQPISLKDSTSQELLNAVVQERNLRLHSPRNAPIFHHPTLCDFEIQNLPVGVSNVELEERIIQHLAAAAAMGRTRHLARREGHRTRSSNQGHQHYLVFSTQPNSLAGRASPARGEGEPHSVIPGLSPSSPVMVGEQSVHMSANQHAQSNLVSSPGSSASTNQHGTPLNQLIWFTSFTRKIVGQYQGNLIAFKLEEILLNKSTPSRHGVLLTSW